MRILYLSAHSILEFDNLSLWSEMGYEVFDLGAYTNPFQPADNKRPSLFYVKPQPELQKVIDLLAVGHEQPFDNVQAARVHLPDELIEWADVILSDAYPDEWLGGNWERIRHKRVVWRTIGQSNPKMELRMKNLHQQGLQIVRYSPAEKRLFESMDSFGGEDAMIRFHKDPDEWLGWTGEQAEVGNVAQHNAKPHERDLFINWLFWIQATQGLRFSFAGLNSELIGGLGALSYAELKAYYRSVRAYLYTGTQPASYTLSLIEAMMTGVPTVSIGKEHMWSPMLFEGDEIACLYADTPAIAQSQLRQLLVEPDREMGHVTRQRAIDLFGKEKIKQEWRSFLG